MNALDLTADEILSITKPENLFTKENLDIIRKRLAGKWHPDKHNGSPKADKVLSHINVLVEQAREKLDNGTWEGPLTIEFTVATKKYRLSSLTSRKFELGKLYIGKSHIVYIVDDSNLDLAKNAISNRLSVKYPTDKMKEQFERQLPNITVHGESELGYVIVINKPDHAVFLSDLLSYLGESIDPKHVAWIGSRMFNLITFLDHIGLCHNAISADSVLISPSKHACYLVGGWWYTAKAGSKLKALPGNLSNLFPKEVFSDKIAKTEYDKRLVKSMLIECLGDPSKTGSRLLMNPDIPKPMLNWLRATSTFTIKEEFSTWYKILEECFGPRKFVEMDINISHIYS